MVRRPQAHLPLAPWWAVSLHTTSTSPLRGLGPLPEEISCPQSYFLCSRWEARLQKVKSLGSLRASMVLRPRGGLCWDVRVPRPPDSWVWAEGCALGSRMPPATHYAGRLWASRSLHGALAFSAALWARPPGRCVSRKRPCGGHRASVLHD